MALVCGNCDGDIALYQQEQTKWTYAECTNCGQSFQINYLEFSESNK